MSSQPGRKLERLVAAMHHAESKGAVVTWNDKINGRQFDVTVRFKFGLHDYLTVIECKDYASKINVEKIDAFVTKSRDAGANKAIFISSLGFQAGCFAVAERHGIQLLVLTETTGVETSELVERTVPALRVSKVFFRILDSSEILELEDWGGRLAYLVANSKVIGNEWEVTPEQIIWDCLAQAPTIELDKENSLGFALPEGAFFLEPYGEKVPVVSIEFSVSFIEARIPSSILFDNHIRQGMSAKIELRDPSGVIQHSARLSSLPLGYDKPVEAGRFYEQPAMYTRYYCDKIEDGLVTWFVVESYQHGHLFQAEYTQKLEYCSHYVEVTDVDIIRRLKGMLERLKSPQS